MLHLHIFLLLFSIFSNFEFRGVKADDSNSSCVADTFLKCKVIKVQVQHTPQCLKIRPKSRIQYCELRSYVYILSGQKFNKNAKNGPFWLVFKNLKLAIIYTVLPDRSLLIGQKLVKNAKIENFKGDILVNFQTMCLGFTYLDMVVWIMV